MAEDRFRKRLALAIVAGLFLFSFKAYAQVDTGSIVGQITDATGGALPGTTILVQEENTGIKTTVKTGSDGSFTVSPLKIGSYSISATLQGFKSSMRQHIDVSIQSRLEVNLNLEVGAVSQVVQVDSAAPVLETQASSVQQLVEARAINDLPLNGRNASFLAQLSPGVTLAQNDSRGLQASGSFVANGLKRTQNDYLLDGMDNNSNIGDLVNQAQYVVMPPPDALREFTVQTSNYSAEFGHSAGAVLNVSTKSGTNAYHGDVWEFLRNDILDAKDYFVLPTQKKPKFRQNQFGGTIGGPLSIPYLYNGHNRTFFFADYQGTRIVQGQTYTKTVPTAAERNSGFTNLQDLLALQSGAPKTDALGRSFPLGTVFDPATTRKLATAVDSVTGLPGAVGALVRDPFYSGSLAGKKVFTDSASIALLNLLPAARFSPIAANILSLYPAPTSAGLTANYTISPANFTMVDAGDIRLDHQFSQRDSAFLRYSYVKESQSVPPPYAGFADGGASRPGNGRTISQNGALSFTHQINSHLVDEARVGYSRVYDRRDQPFAGTLDIPTQLGIPGIPQFAGNGGIPLQNFGILSDLGAANTIPSDKASDVLQFSDNLSVDRNRHQIRVGFEYQHINFPELTPSTPRGNWQYSGIYTSVVNNTDSSTDRAQFLLEPALNVVPGQAAYNYVGGAQSVTASSFPPAFHPLRNVYGAYTQDSWRVTPTFTLNLGLRYEFLGIPSERDGRIGNFVPAMSGDAPDGLTHYYIPQQHLAEIPASVVTQLTNNGVIITPTNDSSIGFAQKTNFAPRVGFALQPTPRMSVRGGYALFFQGNENRGLSTSPYVDFPFQVSLSYTGGSAVSSPSVTTADAVGPLDKGLLNANLTPTGVTPSAISFNGEPRNQKTTYSEDYSLQVQYQVASSTILYAGYVGDRALHVQQALTTNSTSQIVSTSAGTTAQAIAFYPTLATGGSYVNHSGSSNYNSLQFGAERRMQHGLAFTANMTYSKCLGTVRDLLDNGIGALRAPYVPGLGQRIDYSLCSIDIRRVIHGSGTYELPFGRNKAMLKSGPGAVIAGGWSTNFILTAQDGQPFSIACQPNPNVTLGCFALAVPGQPLYTSSGRVQHFVNAAAFANPTASGGTVASLGGPPAQVSGPQFRRLDFSVFRHFTVYKESFLEFRAEAFNLTNTPNFGQPSATTFTTTSTFGQITNTRDNPNDPRELQFSLKLYY